MGVALANLKDVVDDITPVLAEVIDNFDRRSLSEFGGSSSFRWIEMDDVIPIETFFGNRRQFR